MKLLFIVRSTMFTARGGDTIQVEQTARYLSKMGVEVDIKKTNDRMNYGDYDLLHFFNIIRPADILVHIKRSNKPFVVSAILINYSEYDKQYRRGLSGLLFKSMSAGFIEYMKNIYRYAAGKDKIVSLEYLWKGHYRSIREILSKTSVVLVHTADEYIQLVKLYKENPPFAIVRNGIDENLFRLDNPPERKENLVLCVARIEGIKNQYNLIKALNNTDFELVLIGDAAPNQKKYYRACRKIAGSNISFIKHLPQQQLVHYYAEAKVHVLPSWFEVCGLSSLEAAAMGCRVIITDKGYARSYFNVDAFYCDPAKPDSILAAVHKAVSANNNGELKKRVTQSYTWQKTAEKTLSVYKKYIV